jgi:prepilin-type N-terminal cleavage/methylation domain-containing protein
MKEGEKMVEKRKGFTIVELLTVMSVIAILIGLLVPAVGMIKEKANQVQQLAQLHSLEAGLELYKAEFGEYPPSNDNQYTPPAPGSLLGQDPFAYGGAQKLAEALVGLDFLGFHPESEFRSDRMAQLVNPLDGSPIIPADTNFGIYNPSGGIPEINETAEENVKRRGGKLGGPFVDLENANAYRMQDVYLENELTNAQFDPLSVVLCDVYSKTRTAMSGSKKAGMPLLYYRARTQYVQQDINDSAGNGNEDDIYYYRDNLAQITMRTSDQAVDHPLAEDIQEFEDMLVNPQVLEASNIKRPYRAGSYILISAGKDGLYGTADDITNFNRNE